VGVSLRETLEELAEQTDVSGAIRVEMWEEYCSRLARREPFFEQHRLANGIVIAARFKPIAGDGWVRSARM
jgi:hypothetical protein